MISALPEYVSIALATILQAAEWDDAPIELLAVRDGPAVFPVSMPIEAMATAAQTRVANVMGVLRRSPPILRMSCSPLQAWMTLPAPRNRSALKKACVTRWKMPAEKAPTPTAKIM